MGGGTLISLVRFVTFFQRGGFILRPSFSQDCNCWKYTLHLFGAWSSNRPLKDRTGFLPVLHTVRYFCETFIQPVRVSFLHNYHTVFWMQYSKGVYRTVQYFTFTYKGRGFLALWLDPTPFSLGHACLHMLPQSHHFQPDPPKMSCQLSSVQKFSIPYGC